MDTTRPESWLSALQTITNSPALSQKIPLPSENEAFRGRLSCIDSSGLNVSGLYLKTGSVISGLNSESITIVMPVKGKIDFKIKDGHWFCGPWAPLIIDPHDSFQATVSDGTQALIVQLLEPDFLDARIKLHNHNSALANILSCFISKTYFCKNYRHARLQIDMLSESIYRLVHQKIPLTKSAEKKDTRANSDRRLCKAIEIINKELANSLDIKIIATESGTSLRNLHYLFKKQTGQTPYQYIRNRRLIKSREEIIKNHPNKINTGQIGCKWGFGHSGRFSKYYQEIFGEYPTSTLKELDELTKVASRVKKVSENSGRTGHYMISSIR